MIEVFIPTEARPQVVQGLIHDAWIIGAALEFTYSNSGNDEVKNLMLLKQAKPTVDSADVANPRTRRRRDR
jgi:hypothetical protein